MTLVQCPSAKTEHRETFAATGAVPIGKNGTPRAARCHRCSAHREIWNTEGPSMLPVQCPSGKMEHQGTLAATGVVPIGKTAHRGTFAATGAVPGIGKNGTPRAARCHRCSAYQEKWNTEGRSLPVQMVQCPSGKNGTPRDARHYTSRSRVRKPSNCLIGNPPPSPHPYQVVGNPEAHQGASVLTRQALGSAPLARRWEGHKVVPLYFSQNISATRKRRNAKLCTHLPDYLAEGVCKFGADSTSDDVTVTSEVRLYTAFSKSESDVTLWRHCDLT